MNHTSLSTLLSFPFKDPAWFKKLFILGLVMLASVVIPILPWVLVTGYLARLVRRVVVEKAAPTLPEWDDLGGIFNDGWRPFAAAFTLMLPVMALFFVAWSLSILPSISPLSQMWSGDQNIDPYEFLVLMTTNVFGIGAISIASLTMLVITFLLPAALVHTIVRQEYTAAFHFKEWWPIFTSNLSGFIVAYAVSYGISLIFGFLTQILFITILLCCLIPFLIFGYSSYFNVVYAALFADAYRLGAAKASQAGLGRTPPPSEPPATPGAKALEEVSKPMEEPAPEPLAQEAEKPVQAIEAQPTLIQEPIPKPKPARRPGRKTPRKPAEDSTLVQPTDQRDEPQ